MDYRVRRVQPTEVALMRRLLTLFGEVFGDNETYGNHQPDSAYLENLLSGETFLAVAALAGDRVVGGAAAYELKKFEQARSEMYLYDLAVDPGFRRRGVATALIEELRQIAKERGAYVLFVQADTQEEDGPAIALYTKLGVREDVLHFDIPVEPRNPGS